MISNKMKTMVSNSSVIRAMFEEGKRLSEIYGEENVFDYSIGNPNIEAPSEIKDIIIKILNEENPNKLHGYMNNSGYEDVREGIAENINVKAPEYVPYSEKERDKKLQIPQRAKTDQNAIDYLLSRGISFNIIKHCIDHYLLYENEYFSPSTNKVYQNVAFIGWDKKTNKPRHIALRGINQDFIGDATGSDKRYSFCIESSNPDCDTVHINEAPIDVLSQATLFEQDNKEFNHEHILSLTGIYAPRNDTKEIKIPLALQQFLIDHPKIKNIIFHLDLDKVGRQATALIIEIMKLKLPEYTCYDDPPKYYKDTNDNLCMRLGIAKVKSRSKMDNKEYTR